MEQKRKIKKAVISNDRSEEHQSCSMAVKLIPVDLPDDSIPKWEGSNPYAVVAATDVDHEDETRKRWSWVGLDSDEKEVIGAAMMEQECSGDTWYWCLGYPE